VHASLAGYTLAFVTIAEPNMPYLVYGMVIMLLIAGLGCAFSVLLYFKVKNQHLVQKIQLENRSKLAVLASINHEIRTPINAILAYSQMLKEAPPDPFAFDPLIDKIIWSANLLYSVAENTLNYSKAEVGQLRLNPYSVNLREYVGNIQDYYRAFGATSDKRLQMVVSKTLPEFIELDGTQLFQLMTNMINNAFKYSTGSEVHCYLDLRLKPVKGGNRPVLRVLIRDFGDGMSASAKRALVDPFVLDTYASSQAPSSGIGLGLYTCKRLLEQIGGQFMLRSQPGKGTTVILHFPCQLAKAKTRLASEYAQQDVLIVDDNLFSLEVCKAMLSHYGFKTLCVDNAAQALDLLMQQLPQIVIVDYRLRETNGLRLIRQMQQLLQDNRSSAGREPACRFFLLSANDSHEIPEFEQFPEVSFMQKPFRMDLFLSKIDVN
jgi:signal transduction histidine kinase